MSAQMIVAGLDLGAHAVKCVIGLHHEDGQVDIIGTGSHPARGFQNGVVCDRQLAVKSIKSAVAEASLMADVEIKEIFLSVSSRHVESFNSHGMARILDDAVKPEDIHAVIDMACAVKLPADRQILHVVPQDYIVDGRGGIDNPLGSRGVRLEVHGHLVTAHLARLSLMHTWRSRRCSSRLSRCAGRNQPEKA